MSYSLWEGWKDGTVSFIAEGPRFDGSRIARTDFVGRDFRVRGPLDMPSGPQGRPGIVRACASEEGLDFAARHGELVFAATRDLESIIAFYRDQKQRVAEQGRKPERLRVLPGLNIFVAPSSAEAEAEAICERQFTDRSLLAYRDRVVREAPLLRLEELALDERIPASANPSRDALLQVECRCSRGLLLHRCLERPGITLRDFLTTVFEFGHLTLVCTPASIAEDIATWFEGRAADRFVLKGGNSFPPWPRRSCRYCARRASCAPRMGKA